MNKHNKIWHDAFHLKVAFRCMKVSNPHRTDVIEACRKSRRERKYLLQDLRSHYAFQILCIIERVKP